MNKRNMLMLYACPLLLLTACAPMQQAAPRIDAHIESTPANVVWGYIPAARNPVLRVRSGQTVRIDTLSHQPISGGQDPMKFFAAAGIAPSPVLQQILAVFNSVQRPKDVGAHVLT
jgi:hypothetical protein